MCVNWSWKISQLDHIYINQEIGLCQDFVDCKWIFWIEMPIASPQIGHNPTQSRQSCFNSVQSSIVKFLHNPVQSFQSQHNWGTHRRIVPNTFTSCGRLFSPAILEPYWLCKKGSVSASHWPYISLFTFSQSVAIQKIINYNLAGLQKNCGIAYISCRLCLDFVDCIWIVQLRYLAQGV